MYLSHQFERAKPVLQRRRFARLDIQCRAHIRIGSRQYAGYIDNISRGGARLRTISLIRKVGVVILRLPDLPPLRCRLCWSDSFHAGVMFDKALSTVEFRSWAKIRSDLRKSDGNCLEFAELEEFIE